MELTAKGIEDKAFWQSKGIEIPIFNRQAMLTETRENPGWLHFGPGNIFRAFIASLQQNLLNDGLTKFGIIAAAPNDGEIIDKIYRPHDNLSLLVTMMPDQSMRQKVIASVAESLAALPERASDWQRLQEILRAPSLQIISFTITEKGYKLKDNAGTYLSLVQKDLAEGPKSPKSFPAKLVSLLYERYKAGQLPVTLMSLDNCSKNGLVLKSAVVEIAKAWTLNDFVEDGFTDYVQAKLSYPCTMIDKITPHPSEKVQKALAVQGFTDMDFIASSRGSQYAPFVNAEKTEYLVVEDVFVNGRPPLDKAGVIFTDCATVDKVERMKVCTCLNPLHTALAVYGCLLGYKLIADEMQNPLLRKLVEKIGYEEGMRVVTNPGVLDPEKFLAECLTERFPNPAIPDTPQRIACDTSQKMGIRFGETLKAYVEDPRLDASSLTYIPLVIAGWCRYLMGIDDNGAEFAVSPDPLLSKLQQGLTGIKLGERLDTHKVLQSVLCDISIWKTDLYKAGLGEKIEGYFNEMIAGKQAVADTLRKYIGEEI